MNLGKIERNLPKWSEAVALRKTLSFGQVDAVFDVGANAGQYAERLRKDLGFKGLIFSFEPTPDLISDLEKKAKADNYWHIFPFGLSDFNDKKDLYICKGSQYNSFNKPLPENFGHGGMKIKGKQEIEVRKLDDIYPELKNNFNFQNPFLKMDTQGHDPIVVKGGMHCVKNFVALQSEIYFSNIYEDMMDFCETIRFYESLGFHVASIFPVNRGHFPILNDMDIVAWNDEKRY